MSLLCGEPVAAATSPTLCAALLAVSSEGAERDRAGVVGDEPMPCKQKLKAGALIWRENVVKVYKILKAGDMLEAELLVQAGCAEAEGAQS